MSLNWNECIAQAELRLRETPQDAAMAEDLVSHLRIIESLLSAQAWIALAEAKRIRT